MDIDLDDLAARVAARLGKPDQWLTTREAGDHLRLSVRAMEDFRHEDRGPRFHRLPDGRTVRYLRSDLDAWLRAGAGA